MGLRQRIADRIEGLGVTGGSAYAVFLRSGDASTHGHPPCWGAASARMGTEITTAADRLAVWDALVDERDPTALLLFIDAFRTDDAVLQGIIERPSLTDVPASVQVTLVCLEEAAAWIPDHIDNLSPRARQVWEAGPERRAQRRGAMTATIARLKAQGSWAPDSVVDQVPRAAVSLLTRAEADDAVLASSTASAPDRATPGRSWNLPLDVPELDRSFGAGAWKLVVQGRAKHSGTDDRIKLSLFDVATRTVIATDRDAGTASAADTWFDFAVEWTTGLPSTSARTINLSWYRDPGGVDHEVSLNHITVRAVQR